MKKKRSWRYYCDFCKKSGGSGGHMRSHERGCTKNRGRVCGMCVLARLKQAPIDELVSALPGRDPASVDSLRDAASGCPACMLSAIHFSGLQTPPDVDGPGQHVEFDFKAEKLEFWKAVNLDMAEQHPNY